MRRNEVVTVGSLAALCVRENQGKPTGWRPGTESTVPGAAPVELRASACARSSTQHVPTRLEEPRNQKENNHHY